MSQNSSQRTPHKSPKKEKHKRARKYGKTLVKERQESFPEKYTFEKAKEGNQLFPCDSLKIYDRV